jgi:hypothetical protein
MNGDPPRIRPPRRDAQNQINDQNRLNLQLRVPLLDANGAAAAIRPVDVRGLMVKLCRISRDMDESQTHAVEIMTRKNRGFAVDNPKYMLCEGTTSRFGQIAGDVPICYHRQCNCIILVNRDKSIPYNESVSDILSPSEITTLSTDENNNIWTKGYQICNRHNKNLKIPYEFMKVLTANEREENTRFVREMNVKLSQLGSSDSNMVQQLRDMLDEMKHMDRETSIIAHASILAGMHKAVDATQGQLKEFIGEIIESMDLDEEQPENGGIDLILQDDGGEDDGGEDNAMNGD